MTALKMRPASLSGSWEDVKKHAAPLALSLLAVLLMIAIDYILYLIISAIFTAIFGGEYSESGILFGVIFGQIGTLPTTILAQIASVFVMIIPALYFESGDVITFSSVLDKVRKNFIRYLLAGIFFNVVTIIGFVLCVLPGIAVGLTLPVFINKITNTDMPILEAFSSSFSVVFKGQGWSFVGIQILTAISVAIFGVCTCFLGFIVAVPMSSFYLQNLAYNKGLVS